MEIFGSVRYIVISNKSGTLFLLKLSYSKKYLSQSKLKLLYLSFLVSLGESSLIQIPPKVLRSPKFCHSIDSGESTSKLLQS